MKNDFLPKVYNGVQKKKKPFGHRGGNCEKTPLARNGLNNNPFFEV